MSPNYNILALGDSKTYVTYGDWMSRLNTTKLPYFTEEPGRIAGNGWRSDTLYNVIDARLAAAYYTPNYIFINIGVNDYAVTSEADFKTYMLYVIDALHTKWPSAPIYMAKTWKRGLGGWPDTFAGYVDDIIAARPGVVQLGHDERVWLEGGDDGATMTIDGRHYSDAGLAECASQWRTILGISG